MEEGEKWDLLGEYPCMPLKIIRDYEEPYCVFNSRRLAEMVDEVGIALKFKLRDILQCIICLEVRRCAVFQCKLGHLLCAGCFTEVLNESRLQNEIASCPKCQTTISKDLCSRNVAVEKTISELPVCCPYCNADVPPDLFIIHKKNLCDKRPAICKNFYLGCAWEGPYFEKPRHDEHCNQLNANGHEILKCLTIMDQESKKELNLYERIFELLSVEKFSYFDLQFRPTAMIFLPDTFETSKFSAFDNLWFVKGNISDEDEISELDYKLCLKTKLTTPLSIHYLLVKGPYSELDVKPQLFHFTFSDKATESPFQRLVFWHNQIGFDAKFVSKRINFRMFLFINK